MIRAVLFDFGGVITSSPFEAFAAYERRMGLPGDFIRRVNSTNPDTNAWARLERSELSPAEFSDAFSEESAALGHAVPGAEVLALLSGDVRPEMVDAVKRCRERLKTACLTNNFTALEPGAGPSVSLDELFDVVIESRVVGVRKPDPAFYGLACDELGIVASEAVFLDDLGINLKPARAMGMHTIKVTSADRALADLEQAVGFPLT